MKQVYILTSEQAEDLKIIETRISSDVSIINDLLNDESIKEPIKCAINHVLRRIESYCEDMEDILASE